MADADQDRRPDAALGHAEQESGDEQLRPVLGESGQHGEAAPADDRPEDELLGAARFGDPAAVNLQDQIPGEEYARRQAGCRRGDVQRMVHSARHGERDAHAVHVGDDVNQDHRWNDAHPPGLRHGRGHGSYGCRTHAVPPDAVLVLSSLAFVRCSRCGSRIRILTKLSNVARPVFRTARSSETPSTLGLALHRNPARALGGINE